MYLTVLKTCHTHLSTPALRRMLAAALGAVMLLAAVPPASVSAQSRIKDIVNIEGVRENLLVGYGLVVGLNGTGDTLQNAPFTQQSLVGMLERLGVNTRDDIANLRTANVAAVMVTATLPSFTRQGTRLDITVSALGDANSLRGGTLLVTPMLGADGEVYSVAQGPLVVEGFAIQGNAQTIIKEMFLNHLYGGMDEPELKIIDVFVCKLRKKLSTATGGENYIETVWGRGYVLRDPVAEPEVKKAKAKAA